jgi:hypothetical protein
MRHAEMDIRGGIAWSGNALKAGEVITALTVERTHIGHETRYTKRDADAVRAILVFDTGEDGGGPAEWKILLPGPHQAEDLYGTRQGFWRNGGQIEAWLMPIVGPGTAAELAAAVEAEPPRAAAWPRPPDQ